MKDLRNHINSAANQHKEFVDNDKLWADIQHKMIEPKKKRRFFPFFIWGLFVSLVGIALIWNITDTPNDETIAFKSKSKHSGNDLSQSEKTLTTDKINTPLQNKPKEITNDVNIYDNKSIGNITNKKIAIQASSSSKTTNTKQGQEILFTPYINPHINSTLLNTHPTIRKGSDINEIHLNTETANIGKIIKNKLINIQTIEFAQTPLVFESSRLQILPIYAPPIAISSVDKKHFSLLSSLTIYGQYAFGKKTIQAFDDYTALRNESEELLEQVRVGIESDLINVLDFKIYGGVSYVSINDRVTSTETYFENREIEYLKSIFTNTDGSQIENYVTEELPHLIQNRRKRYNSHNLVSIPIGVRFGKNISNLNLSIGFGLDFNYYLSDVHNILDPNVEIATINVGGKWLSPTLHTGFSVDYPISEYWSLHSNVSYRNTKIKNSFLDNTIQENYSLYGLDLGLKFQF